MTESGGQLGDVSQHKASRILSLTKPLDGPPGLATPDIALWAFLGTIFSLGPINFQIWEVPEYTCLAGNGFCFIQVPHGSYCPS